MQFTARLLAKSTEVTAVDRTTLLITVADHFPIKAGDRIVLVKPPEGGH